MAITKYFRHFDYTASALDEFYCLFEKFGNFMDCGGGVSKRRLTPGTKVGSSYLA
jgi:hypothetical protein